MRRKPPFLIGRKEEWIQVVEDLRTIVIRMKWWFDLTGSKADPEPERSWGYCRFRQILSPSLNHGFTSHTFFSFFFFLPRALAHWKRSNRAFKQKEKQSNRPWETNQFIFRKWDLHHVINGSREAPGLFSQTQRKGRILPRWMVQIRTTIIKGIPFKHQRVFSPLTFRLQTLIQEEMTNNKTTPTYNRTFPLLVPLDHYHEIPYYKSKRTYKLAYPNETDLDLKKPCQC